MAVHIAIGNSDNRLTQKDWAAYIEAVDTLIELTGWPRFGTWFSAPESEYQNACFAFEPLDTPSGSAVRLRRLLRAVAKDFYQDSISWNESETMFVGPDKEAW